MNLVVQKKLDKKYDNKSIPNTFAENSSFIGKGNFFVKIVVVERVGVFFGQSQVYYTFPERPSLSYL